LLSELTSTPNELVSGAGDGFCDGAAEGEAEDEGVRDELAAAADGLPLPAP
jgi:hypothetical protein